MKVKNKFSFICLKIAPIYYILIKYLYGYLKIKTTSLLLYLKSVISKIIIKITLQ